MQLFLGLVCVGSALGGSPFSSSQELHAFPFIRLLDQHGPVGSTSSFGGSSHVLRTVSSQSELTSYLTESHNSHFALALPGRLLTPDNLAQLNSHKYTGSIAVFDADPNSLPGFSPVDPYPSKQQSLNPTSTHVWNTWGNKLRFSSLHKPLVLISTNETSAVLGAASENARRGFSHYPRHHLMVDSFMHAAHDAQTCLRRGYCQPLGGRSVWASLGTPSPSRHTVMLAAASDADSLFYLKAHGTNAATSGTVAVLAAMEGLSRVPEVATSDVRIMSALFTGEAFGRIGSRRFVNDLLHFECTKGPAKDTPMGPGVACAEPHMADTTFTLINASNVRAVIELQMVGGVGVAQSSGFVLHSTPKAASLSTKITSQVPNVRESTTPDFPPGSAEAFAGSEIASMVLSDFDVNYTDSFFHSRFDVSVDAERVCNAAKAAASAALIAANISTASPVPVNCSLVAEVIACFSGHLTCPLLQRFGFPSDLEGTTWVDEAERVNLYASVYRVKTTATVPLLVFAQSFLSHVTTPAYPNLTPCSKSAKCPSGWSCVAGRCAQGVAEFHRAVSPGLNYDSSSGKFEIVPGTIESTWTESDWRSLRVYIHEMENSGTEVGFLFLGIALVLVTYLVVRFLPSRIRPWLFGTS